MTGEHSSFSLASLSILTANSPVREMLKTSADVSRDHFKVLLRRF